jgi:hypothetical protein
MSQGQQGRCPSQVAPQARKSFLLSRAGKYGAGATLARAPSRLLAQKEIVTADALQDLVPIEVSQNQPLTLDEINLLADDFNLCEPPKAPSAGALQDLACVQVPLLAGVVSLLIGDALQDRFATFARELVDRGKRVLATER